MPTVVENKLWAREHSDYNCQTTTSTTTIA